ncbi:MAG: hypothetical protein HY344_01830 [Candidatus Levybacteria bacterium]|nr:hypothetical protein [Candidatus Levybacteria bacterium]
MGSKGGAATQTSNTDFVNQNQSSQKGFTKMIRENPQKQKDIASKGGRAAHQRGTAHEWTSEEAKAAGRLGGRSKSQD